MVQLNHVAFSWTTDTAVAYSVRNPDGVNLYWQCPMLELQIYRDGWQHVWPNGGCLEEDDPFHALALGDSVAGVLPLTNDRFPRSGWYRLQFDLYQAKWGTLWPDASRTSAAFHVGP